MPHEDPSTLTRGQHQLLGAPSQSQLGGHRSCRQIRYAMLRSVERLTRAGSLAEAEECGLRQGRIPNLAGRVKFCWVFKNRFVPVQTVLERHSGGVLGGAISHVFIVVERGVRDS